MERDSSQPLTRTLDNVRPSGEIRLDPFAGQRSAMSTQAFDPVGYKETTRKQWQEAAEAWDR
jgi:hypothetical protein